MSADVLTEADLKLEDDCWACNRGKKFDKGKEVVCDMCGGQGKHTTQFGDAVLDFVRRRLTA